MKDIPRYENLYAATEDGQIWSYPKLCGRRKHNGVWLQPGKNKDGYLCVILSKNEQRKSFKVHRLIAETFIPRPIRFEVNHKNFDKTDCRVENLEWLTSKENVRHSSKHNVGHPKGELAGNAKLTNEKVREMRRLRTDKKVSYKELGKMFGVDDSVISRIINRQTWSHI